MEGRHLGVVNLKVCQRRIISPVNEFRSHHHGNCGVLPCLIITLRYWQEVAHCVWRSGGTWGTLALKTLCQAAFWHTFIWLSDRHPQELSGRKLWLYSEKSEASVEFGNKKLSYWLFYSAPHILSLSSHKLPVKGWGQKNVVTFQKTSWFKLKSFTMFNPSGNNVSGRKPLIMFVQGWPAPCDTRSSVPSWLWYLI